MAGNERYVIKKRYNFLVVWTQQPYTEEWESSVASYDF